MLKTVLRSLTALALLAGLLCFGLIDSKALGLAFGRLGMLAVATGFMFLALLLSGVRWHMLLRAQEFVPPLLQTLRLVVIGAFFSTFLPGGVGGDLVRGAYIFRATRGRRTSALLSLFVDRVIGASGLIFLAAAAALTRSGHGMGTTEWGLVLMATVLITGVPVLFIFGHRIARLLNLLLAGRSKRLALVVDEATSALELYFHEWLSVVICLMLSMVICVLSVSAIVVIAMAMQFNGLSAVDYGIASVYAIVANTIPFTPGGLGIGETAFASACVALEPVHTATPYGTIFLVFRCVGVLSSLPGLLVYLLHPWEIIFRGRAEQIAERASSGLCRAPTQEGMSPPSQ